MLLAHDNPAAAKARLGNLSKSSPQLMRSFSEVTRVASAPGTMSAGQKELVAIAVAIAIAVATGCEDCILCHLDGAMRPGVGEAELLEVLSVAVEMGDGPAVMHAARALEAWQALASEH